MSAIFPPAFVTSVLDWWDPATLHASERYPYRKLDARIPVEIEEENEIDTTLDIVDRAACAVARQLLAEAERMTSKPAARRLRAVAEAFSAFGRELTSLDRQVTAVQAPVVLTTKAAPRRVRKTVAKKPAPKKVVVKKAVKRTVKRVKKAA